MKNDFDRVASSYGFLSKLIFGDQLLKAQCTFLQDIKEETSVLIVGGGNGEILELLTDIKKIQIDFVESSLEMISLARERVASQLVNFHHLDFTDFSGQYDVVIANFFLDCFEGERLEDMANHLLACLKEHGMLLVTDFQCTSSLRHRVLNWAMHLYFRLFAKLDAKKLSDIQKVLDNKALRLEDIKSYNRHHIFSAKYRAIS